MTYISSSHSPTDVYLQMTQRYRRIFEILTVILTYIWSCLKDSDVYLKLSQGYWHIFQVLTALLTYIWKFYSCNDEHYRIMGCNVMCMSMENKYRHFGGTRCLHILDILTGIFGSPLFYLYTASCTMNSKEQNTTEQTNSRSDI